ncbi:MAG: Hsp20/alpha crystallin family protein [Verrucomicrobiota bacterium]
MSLLNNILPSFARTEANTAAATATATAEQCPASAVQTVRPVYEVSETAEAYAVTVQLPGVAKDGLEVSAEDGQVRIVGQRAWKQPEGWTPLYRESADAAYELVLTHDNGIDAEKVAAELRDGVLRVTLPKAEAVKPRKIAIG